MAYFLCRVSALLQNDVSFGPINSEDIESLDLGIIDSLENLDRILIICMSPRLRTRALTHLQAISLGTQPFARCWSIITSANPEQ